MSEVQEVYQTVLDGDLDLTKGKVRAALSPITVSLIID
jgi:hypothetical protein